MNQNMARVEEMEVITKDAMLTDPPQYWLMSRLLFDESAFQRAVDLGITMDSWSSPWMATIWSAMNHNKSAGRPHDLPSIAMTAKDSNAMILMVNVYNDFHRTTTLNIDWHIESAFACS